MADEARIFHQWLLYNWETRETRFFTNKGAGEGSIGEFYRGWEPKKGDKLYILETYLKAPEERPEPGYLRLAVVREDDKTRPGLLEGKSLVQYVTSGLQVLGAMPPNSIGPEKGPYRESAPQDEWTEKRAAIYASIPGHKFKITVEEIE